MSVGVGSLAISKNSIRMKLTWESFHEVTNKRSVYMQSKEVLKEETTGSAHLAQACRSFRTGKGGTEKGQVMQKGNTMNWKPERDRSERHRLTLSAVRWNSPWDPLEGALPRREGGSRIPTLCRERWGSEV
jgi:hypothetical protein